MRLLLDTHAFLWFIGGDRQLSMSARRLIEDESNIRYLSIASAWEIAIKVGVGKLDLRMPLAAFWDQIPGNGITLLSIGIEQLSVIAELPLHHRDPFDRLLIAQTLAERLPIVSADALFDTYPITRLW